MGMAELTVKGKLFTQKSVHAVAVVLVVVALPCTPVLLNVTTAPYLAGNHLYC